MVHQVVGEEKMLRYFKKTIFTDRFVFVFFLREAEFVFDFQTTHEHRQISFLVLCEVRFGVSMVEPEEVSLDFTVTEFIVVDLRDSF
jgi:hypothetical protein